MTYRVWLKKGCHVQIVSVRHDGAPDDLPQAVEEQVGERWEIRVAEPMDQLNAKDCAEPRHPMAKRAARVV